MRYNRDMTQSLFVRRLEELMLQSNEKDKIEYDALYCRIENTDPFSDEAVKMPMEHCAALLKGGAVR